MFRNEGVMTTHVRCSPSMAIPFWVVSGDDGDRQPKVVHRASIAQEGAMGPVETRNEANQKWRLNRLFASLPLVARYLDIGLITRRSRVQIPPRYYIGPSPRILWPGSGRVGFFYPVKVRRRGVGVPQIVNRDLGECRFSHCPVEGLGEGMRTKPPFW